MAFHEPIVWGCLQHTERDDLKNEFGEVVETFFTEDLEPEEFLRDFVDYWNAPGAWDSMPDHRKDAWRELQPKILSEVRLLCYDRTPARVLRGHLAPNSDYDERGYHPLTSSRPAVSPPPHFPIPAS